MKKFLIFLVLAGIGYGVYWYYNQNGNEVEAREEYIYEKSEKGDLKIYVEATGIIIPNTIPLAEIKSKASGTIKSFKLQPGDYIKKGDLIVEIDEVDENRNVKREEANLKVAMANLSKAKESYTLEEKRKDLIIKRAQSELTRAKSDFEEAKRQYERRKELFKSGSISEQEVDSAKNAYEVAAANMEKAELAIEEAELDKGDLKLKQAEIKALEAAKEKAEIQLEEATARKNDTKIYAKFDCRVIEKKVNEGDIISSGISSVSGGSTLATVADLTKVYVEADIDESDIGKVKVGADVDITLDAYPEKVFKGSLDRIAPQGIEDNNVTIVRVKIMVLDPSEEIMRINTTANVSILVDSAIDVVIVPNEAVRLKEDKYGVYVKSAEEPVWKDIERGISNDVSTVILTGLEPGQEVVTKGMEKSVENSRGNFLFGRRGGSRSSKGSKGNDSKNGGGRSGGSKGEGRSGGGSKGGGRPGGSKRGAPSE